MLGAKHYLNQCWFAINQNIRNSFSKHFVINIQTFSSKKMHLKVLSARCQPFYLGFPSPCVNQFLNFHPAKCYLIRLIFILGDSWLWLQVLPAQMTWGMLDPTSMRLYQQTCDIHHNTRHRSVTWHRDTVSNWPMNMIANVTFDSGDDSMYRCLTGSVWNIVGADNFVTIILRSW